MLYRPLVELEEVNTNCRIQLTKTLDRYHNVRTIGGRGEETEDRCRGIALFLAFEPWKTSLQCPPGSARFFDLAEKHKLISSADAAQLSRALIRHGAEMARVYNGEIQQLLFRAASQNHPAQSSKISSICRKSALAIGGSWADQFYEASPFPLQPSRHLEIQSFRPVTFQGEIEFYSQTPWLAWVEALDLVCLGCWAGLRSDTIIGMMQRDGAEAFAGSAQLEWICRHWISAAK